MKQSADDIWRSIVNGIGIELETQVNVLSGWAEIFAMLVDQFEGDSP